MRHSHYSTHLARVTAQFQAVAPDGIVAKNWLHPASVDIATTALGQECHAIAAIRAADEYCRSNGCTLLGIRCMNTYYEAPGGRHEFTVIPFPAHVSQQCPQIARLLRGVTEGLKERGVATTTSEAIDEEDQANHWKSEAAALRDCWASVYTAAIRETLGRDPVQSDYVAGEMGRQDLPDVTKDILAAIHSAANQVSELAMTLKQAAGYGYSREEAELWLHSTRAEEDPDSNSIEFRPTH